MSCFFSNTNLLRIVTVRLQAHAFQMFLLSPLVTKPSLLCGKSRTSETVVFIYATPTTARSPPPHLIHISRTASSVLCPASPSPSTPPYLIFFYPGNHLSFRISLILPSHGVGSVFHIALIFPTTLALTHRLHLACSFSIPDTAQIFFCSTISTPASAHHDPYRSSYRSPTNAGLPTSCSAILTPPHTPSFFPIQLISFQNSLPLILSRILLIISQLFYCLYLPIFQPSY